MKNIAVICSGISVAVLRENFEGIRDCAKMNNCNIFVVTCDDASGGQTNYGNTMIYEGIDFSVFDGAIIMDNSILDENQMERVHNVIQAAGIPWVTVEGKNSDAYNICIDNRGAMYEMMLHMINHHGYRKICFVTGPLNNPEARDRLDAYKECMDKANLPYSDNWIYEGSFMPQSGREAAEYFIMRLGIIPDAIVCSNDLEAQGVHQYLTEHGIRVPGQVAVTGFDDVEQARYYDPRLTTVSRESYKTGYTACAKLIEGPAEEGPGAVKIIRTKVVVRESCGCTCEEEIDNTMFRKLHFDLVQKQEYNQVESRRVAIDMTTVESISDINNILLTNIRRTGCTEFYVCLSNDWEGVRTEDGLSVEFDLPELKEASSQKGFGSGMFLMFGYSKRAQMNSNNRFMINDLIDEINNRKIGRACYVVMPLYFKNSLFGYCIIANGDGSLDSDFYSSWVLNISNGLENIRKQNLMRAMIRKLDSLWVYDNLTGLYNRSGFGKYGETIWNDCINNGDTAALLFIDLDGLKRVNDCYGHESGDKYIKAIAGILKRLKRHGEAIMRFGGDEFVVLSRNLDENETLEYCNNIYREVENYNKLQNLPCKVSVSIGYSISNPKEGSRLEDAIEEADERMYQAKKRKR